MENHKQSQWGINNVRKPGDLQSEETWKKFPARRNFQQTQ